MGDLHSGFGTTRGYPPQTAASCRQLDHARGVSAFREFGSESSDRAYSLSNFCGGRSNVAMKYLTRMARNPISEGERRSRGRG